MSSEFKMMSYGKIKYKCPCCGCYTYEKRPSGDFAICPVCFWEDDPVQLEDETFKGGANDVCLLEARENYKKYGACEQRFTRNVRRPLADELDEAD